MEEIPYIIAVVYGLGIFVGFVLLVAILIVQIKKRKEEKFEKRDF